MRHFPAALALALVAGCATVEPDKTSEVLSGTSEPTTPTVVDGNEPIALDELGFVVGGSGALYLQPLDVGDVTGDGLLDLFDVSEDHEVRVLAGPLVPGDDLAAPDGVVTFDGWGLGDCSQADYLGDIDGDGVGDVACTTVQWSFYEDSGASAAQLGPLVGTVDGPPLRLHPRGGLEHDGAVHAAVGDLDGDGADEVAMPWIPDETDAKIGLASLGDGPVPSRFLLGARTPHPVGDLDGDGTIDLLTESWDGLALVYTGPWWADAPVDEVVQPVSASFPYDVRADRGTLDADGRADLLVVQTGREAPACLVSGTALGPDSAELILPDAALSCWSVGLTRTGGGALIDDLDGDGLDEVALLFTPTNVEADLYLLSGAAAAAGAGLDEGVRLEGLVHDVRAVDLTGDGLDDLVLQRDDGDLQIVPHDVLADLLP